MLYVTADLESWDFFFGIFGYKIWNSLLARATKFWGNGNSRLPCLIPWVHIWLKFVSINWTILNGDLGFRLFLKLSHNDLTYCVSCNFWGIGDVDSSGHVYRGVDLARSVHIQHNDCNFLSLLNPIFGSPSVESLIVLAFFRTLIFAILRLNRCF